MHNVFDQILTKLELKQSIFSFFWDKFDLEIRAKSQKYTRRWNAQYSFSLAKFERPELNNILDEANTKGFPEVWKHINRPNYTSSVTRKSILCITLFMNAELKLNVLSQDLTKKIQLAVSAVIFMGHQRINNAHWRLSSDKVCKMLLRQSLWNHQS